MISSSNIASVASLLLLAAELNLLWKNDRIDQMFLIRKTAFLSNSRTTLTSALRNVHFRPAPHLKETKATETSSSQGLVVDDFVVHSPARNHVRDYKTETKDQSYLMPHAVYSPKEVLDLKTDVHYTPKVSTKEKYYH